MRRLLLLLLLALATASPAAAGGGYAYAGLFGESAVGGVAATITPTAATVVPDGHVAAWVNMGAGSAWLQVGLNVTVTGGVQTIYYELRMPGAGEPLYVALGTVAPGKSVRVAIVETRPSTWQVTVDGVPAAAPVAVAGSHGRWRGSTAAEAFTRSGASPSYAYRFDAVGVLVRGRWTSAPLVAAADAGFRIARSRDGFAASSL